MPSVGKVRSSIRRTHPYAARYNLRSIDKIFPFIDLPGEIRNQIYSHVVDSRDHTLFRTSKQIRNEGLPRFFRLRFTWEPVPPLREKMLGAPNLIPLPIRMLSVQNLIPLPKPTLSATDLIQDLEIHINAGTYALVGDTTHHIAYFRDNGIIIRESCTVILHLFVPGWIHADEGRQRPFPLLRTLTGFKRLKVRFN